MTDDINDGSDKPIGSLSEDGELEVREVDGERCWHETPLGQHQRWLRQAPDLYELYHKALGELAKLQEAQRSAAALRSEIETLKRADDGSKR